MSIHILHPVTCSTAPSLVDVLILRLLIMLDTDNYFEPDELIIASLGFNIGPFTHFREICDLPRNALSSFSIAAFALSE